MATPSLNGLDPALLAQYEQQNPQLMAQYQQMQQQQQAEQPAQTQPQPAAPAPQLAARRRFPVHSSNLVHSRPFQHLGRK
jgi:hypothetical protein